MGLDDAILLASGFLFTEDVGENGQKSRWGLFLLCFELVDNTSQHLSDVLDLTHNRSMAEIIGEIGRWSLWYYRARWIILVGHATDIGSGENDFLLKAFAMRLLQLPISPARDAIIALQKRLRTQLKPRVGPIEQNGNAIIGLSWQGVQIRVNLRGFVMHALLLRHESAIGGIPPWHNHWYGIVQHLGGEDGLAQVGIGLSIDGNNELHVFRCGPIVHCMRMDGCRRVRSHDQDSEEGGEDEQHGGQRSFSQESSVHICLAVGWSLGRGLPAFVVVLLLLVAFIFVKVHPTWRT